MKRRRKRKNPSSSGELGGFTTWLLVATGFVVVVAGLKRLGR